MAVLVIFLRPADAAPFAVTKTADSNDGVCDVDCSLREAVIAANAVAGADIITLPAGTYTLITPGADEDFGAMGDLDIAGDLTINGAGAATSIIQACDSTGGPCTGFDRVFHILSGTVSISGVTIRNGTAFNASPFLGSGGGIYSASGSALMLTNSTVSDNSASGGGGGIRNVGSMTIINSAVSGNSAGGGSVAGGIRNDGTLTLIDSTVSDGNSAPTVGGILNNAILTLDNSTVSGNTATNFGGAGIFNNGAGTATITNSTVSTNTAVGGGGGGFRNDGILALSNSTVSGNSSNGDGGGIYNFSGTATITNSTITDNTADLDDDSNGDGGGIFRFAGTVNLKNTILAGNNDPSSTTVEPDCFGTLTSQGYNLIQTVSAGCTISGDAATNVTGQSANLGPLALNAPGTTETHAILNGSPAIDFASADCPPPAMD